MNFYLVISIKDKNAIITKTVESTTDEDMKLAIIVVLEELNLSKFIQLETEDGITFINTSEIITIQVVSY